VIAVIEDFLNLYLLFFQKRHLIGLVQLWFILKYFPSGGGHAA